MANARASRKLENTIEIESAPDDSGNFLLTLKYSSIRVPSRAPKRRTFLATKEQAIGICDALRQATETN